MVDKGSAKWFVIMLFRVMLGSCANEDSINWIDCEPLKWPQQCFPMSPLSPLPAALVP